MPTDDEVLNQELTNAPQRQSRTQSNDTVNYAKPAPPQESCYQLPSDYSQWTILPNNTFRPSSQTCLQLPSAVYAFEQTQYGIQLVRVNVCTDSLSVLPDTINETLLAQMKTFWNREEVYRKHGLLYKRGILLWGPPGGGKTATLGLLTQELITNQNGLVVLCHQPELTSQGIAMLRRVEPKRRIICLIEDIDEIIRRFGEHSLLALLDGENQVDNIVNIATTNYPADLGARIVNRPARFDIRLLVKMPSREARYIYLKKVASALGEEELVRWAEDTDGLSIAHLRELAAAVLCLGEDYLSVLHRLQLMKHKLNDNGTGTNVGFVPGS